MREAAAERRGMADRIDVLIAVCNELTADRRHEAEMALEQGYPFVPEAAQKRSYRQLESTRVFMRDGFIDRYTGAKLIYPPVLRLISAQLPMHFPFDPHWRTAVTHSAYWEVGATVDHVVPVTLGGADDDSNWVTTSMARNFAKMNWTLEYLGWKLYPSGSLSDWDGLLNWYLTYTERRPLLVAKGNMRQWHRAAVMSVEERSRRFSDWVPGAVQVTRVGRLPDMVRVSAHEERQDRLMGNTPIGGWNT